MRLKFGSLSLLDHQNMPKPIPHCSNFGKIIFLKKGQSNNLSANSYLMSTPNVDLLHWNLSWALTFINLLMRQGVEVYIKDFSKFHHFTPVLSSWWFSIHLLELKIQMSRIPPCHTSKVASWHVDYWYDLHLWSSLSKIWLKVSKSGKNWQYCR